MTGSDIASGGAATNRSSQNRQLASAEDRGSRSGQLAEIPRSPIALAQQALPTSLVPVALGAGARVLAGVLELPVAGAIGLGYLAARNWRRR